MHLHMADCSSFCSPKIQAWINERHEVQVASGSTFFNFDTLLELSSRRYHSNYYAEWLSKLSAQTPSGHPDKEPLLSAVAYYRESPFCADSTSTRNEIVQRVLANEDSVGSLPGKVLTSRSYAEEASEDESDFAELSRTFHHDHFRLQEITRDLQHYCREVKEYCAKFMAMFESLGVFMRFHPSQHPEAVSKWTLFAVSCQHSFREERIPDSYVRRQMIHSTVLLRPKSRTY